MYDYHKLYDNILKMSKIRLGLQIEEVQFHLDRIHSGSVRLNFVGFTRSYYCLGMAQVNQFGGRKENQSRTDLQGPFISTVLFCTNFVLVPNGSSFM